MTRQSIALAFTLLAAAVVTPACDDKQSAEQAQNEADKAKAKASADALKSQAEADKAQAEADAKKAELNAAFMKTQADYRAAKDKDLVDIDRSIADMRASAATATGAAKVEDDRLLADVTTRREAVRTGFTSMTTGTAATWDATKASLDKAMDDLKAAVRAASGKIKVKAAAVTPPPTNPNKR